jgi:predicted dehydrogenase
VRALAEGMIGQPKIVSLNQFTGYSSAEYVDLPSWWFDASQGGGWLGCLGSHLVDWTRSLLGEFASVSAALPSVSGPGGGAEDAFLLRFTLTYGVEGVMAQTSGAWGYADYNRIAGSRGMIWFDHGALHIHDGEGPREVPVPPDLVLPQAPPIESDDPRFEGIEWKMLYEIEVRPYIALCETFKAAIEGRTPKSPVKPATFADGLAEMQVLDAIRASAKAGGAVVEVGRG